MLEYLIKANVLGILLFFIPAYYIFIRISASVETELVERKLYLACGIGSVFGSIAEALTLGGGLKSYSEDIGFSSLIFVTPLITISLLYVSVNFKTFRKERYAGYYAAGVGLFYGASKEFWSLWVLETNIGELSLGVNLIDLLMGMAFVTLLGGCGLWMGEACRVGEDKLRMFGRLTLLCILMNFLLVSSMEMTSVIVDYAGAFTVGAVGMTLLRRGQMNLPKKLRDS